MINNIFEMSIEYKNSAVHDTHKTSRSCVDHASACCTKYQENGPEKGGISSTRPSSSNSRGRNFISAAGGGMAVRAIPETAKRGRGGACH